jgi:hypothetical protein
MRENRGTGILAGIGMLLALVAASLLLVGLADPTPGLAAGVPGAAGAPAAAGMPAVADQAGTGPSQGITATVFLPIISRPEPFTPNTWTGEYYPNANLTEPPAYTTEEVRVDYDWGAGAPSGLPKDLFSVRWTGYWDFDLGRYTFFILADDGVRLWLDDELIIDAWTVSRSEHQKTVVVETAGLHKLKLEYFEDYELATIRLHWRRTDLYPQWQGDYYTLPWVESGWLYDQTDSAIQFDWVDDCPSGLPCDGFSIAWNATPVFEAGSHRFYLYADDGYQLLVDGTKVHEGGWYDGQGGGQEDVTYDLEVDEVEQHDITYNFHDRGSLAEARLWIVDLERPYWTAEYYGNMNLSGEPLTTKSEAAVFYDWGYDKPYPVLPSGDHFSVRWSGARYFHAGCYRFGFFVDDGVRLWVDGELLVNKWVEARAEYYSPATYLTTGYHNLVIDYYENSGEAEIRFWWE